MARRLFAQLFFYAVPLLVFVRIWLPEVEHNYIPNDRITEAMVDQARRQPEEAVFRELEEFSLGLKPLWKNDDELIAAAEKMMRGEIEIAKKFSGKFHVPFSAEDVEKGLPTSQLSLAAFVVPKVLTDAYQRTKEEKYLMTARDIILGWAAYERTAWFPKGLLWNNHAISARIPVLAQFWRVYRSHPRYDPETAKAILLMVARSARLLADPAHFTFSTNHGIMQNLALWHLCIAFPDLPEVEKYKRVALSRMREQMLFYMSDEGVILEHSPGYHREGMQMISAALKYLDLMKMPAPEAWKEKYRRGKDFYAQLKRPDGSLPMLGDTVSLQDPYGPRVRGLETDGPGEVLDDKIDSLPKRAASLYPISGYALWWNGLDRWPDPRPLNQSAVAWSYFPGHGHKHADEMSVSLWAGGQTWWTNVGYWPYGEKGREEAVSWMGSNAPHLIEEPAESVRSARLRSYGEAERAAVVDLERRGPGAYVAHRQVVHWRPNLWVIVDSATGRAGDRTATAWTASHQVDLSEGPTPGAYDLKVKESPLRLKAFILASENTKIKQLKGSMDPFGGWEVVDYFNVPAPAVVVEQPVNGSWAATLWSLEAPGSAGVKLAGAPAMQSWEDPDHWSIALPTESGRVQIGREGERVRIDEAGRPPQEIALLPGPEIQGPLEKIRAAYETAAVKYRYNNLFDYRVKITRYLVAIFLLQEIFFFVCRRAVARFYFGFRVLNIVGWAGVGLWLVYFRL